MKRLGLLILLLGAGAAVVSWFRGEPRYQGKTLSGWLDLYAEAGIALRVPSQPPLSAEKLAQARQSCTQAQQAVRAMGAKILPELVRMLQTPDKLTPWKVELNRLLARQKLVAFRFAAYSGPLRRRMGAAGCEILGPLAKPAIPELVRVAQANYDPACGFHVCWALARMGPEGVSALRSLVAQRGPADRTPVLAISALAEMGPAAAEAVPDLLQALTNWGGSQYVRGGAAHALGAIGAKEAVPHLLARLKSYDSGERAAAASALGKLGASPELVVPALLEQVARGDAFPYLYLEALGRFGTNAARAAPVIERALAQWRFNEPATDAQFRQTASEALRRIRGSPGP